MMCVHNGKTIAWAAESAIIIDCYCHDSLARFKILWRGRNTTPAAAVRDVRAARGEANLHGNDCYDLWTCGGVSLNQGIRQCCGACTGHRP
jgi:hypothetical protein